MATRPFHFAVITIAPGLGGIVAQSVLLKELFILFSWNELSFGMILGAWIAAEGAGAYAGGRFRTGRTGGNPCGTRIAGLWTAGQVRGLRGGGG